MIFLKHHLLFEKVKTIRKALYKKVIGHLNKRFSSSEVGFYGELPTKNILPVVDSSLKSLNLKQLIWCLNETVLK